MTTESNKDPKSVYDFNVKDAKGDLVDLTTYKGKVLLIVNVASKCGLTNSNYTELNQLYEKYKDEGMEILAFPCNQFREQEPESNDKIVEFVCTRFKSEFPIFDKIEVNGDNSAPLYKFLKAGKWGIFGDEIQWNFAKFLVDKDGQVVGRYYPTTSPLSLEIIKKDIIVSVLLLKLIRMVYAASVILVASFLLYCSETYVSYWVSCEGKDTTRQRGRGQCQACLPEFVMFPCVLAMLCIK